MALAEEILCRFGNRAQIIFISALLPPHLAALLADRGIKSIMIGNGNILPDPADDAKMTLDIIKQSGGADLVVVDAHHLNFDWDRRVGTKVPLIAGFDDLAEEERAFDILINQNPLDGIDLIYKKWRYRPQKLLLGLSYAPVRQEIVTLAKNRTFFSSSPRRVVVSFGGGKIDKKVLDKTLEALKTVNQDNIEIDLFAVTEPAQADDIPAGSVNVHTSWADLPFVTARADLAIGALGVSTWERMALGLVSIIVTISEVQIRPAVALHEKKLAVYCGHFDKISAEDIAGAIKMLVDSDDLFRAMRVRGRELVDTRGAQRVINGILGGC